MEDKDEQGLHGRLAGFSDRAVAFSVDVGVFSAGYFLSLPLLFHGESAWSSPHRALWKVVWIALFLLYEAFSSCEGRRSLGKAALGLRVVDIDGEPLTLSSAVIRSLGYLVSSVFNLGFLWSLFSRTRQCWHDLAAGSVVVLDAPRGAGARLLVRAGALACVGFAAGQWYWNRLAAPRYHRIMDVAYAKVGLREISGLEGLYFEQHGRYARSIVSLAPFSGAPEVFLRDMDRLFDRKDGVQIDTTSKSFNIRAKAVDDQRTLVALNGP